MSNPASPPPAPETLSFEAAMAELETIVRRLEGGDVNLEESVTLYERGQALRQHCEARLKAAELRVEQVSVGADGQPTGTIPLRKWLMSIGAVTESDLLDEALADVADAVDLFFDHRLVVPDDPRARLYAAMRHAAIGGGKRLRPLLVRASADIFRVDRNMSLTVGAAVEAMHVYSLIHDDLPCMDDDDLRRGKPTVHKAYDEATAVLAGDSLHALAFEWLAHPDAHPDPFVRAELLLELSRAAGPAGMAGGQMMDLAAESANFDLATVSRLQQLKTGALIAFSVEAGAILGRIPHEGRRALMAYARDIGLAFQIADDIMDVEGDEALAGKALHKDEAAGKETFVTLMGLDRAKAQADLLMEQAIAHLGGFGEEADLLRAIARYIVERDH